MQLLIQFKDSLHQVLLLLLLLLSGGGVANPRRETNLLVGRKLLPLGHKLYSGGFSDGFHGDAVLEWRNLRPSIFNMVLSFQCHSECSCPYNGIDLLLLFHHL
jgi:hypothetical protein